MSIHPCEWASQKGCELKLSCPERVTLWQLARRAATKGFCWPSLVQLVFDTGLHKETLVKVVRALADRGLIRIERDGQRHVYHLLQSVGNPTDQSESRPVGASRKSDRSNGKTDRPTGLKSDRNRSEKPPEPVGKPDPNLKENIKTNHARAREAAANGGEPENKILNSQTNKEESAAQPPPQDPFAGLDEAKAWMGKALGRAVHLDAPEPAVLVCEVPEPEEPVGPKATSALVHGFGRSLRHFALPCQAPARDKWQQIDGLAAAGIVSPFQPQEPIRSPAEQIATLLGISLEDAQARLPAA